MLGVSPTFIVRSIVRYYDRNFNPVSGRLIPPARPALRRGSQNSGRREQARELREVHDASARGKPSHGRAFAVELDEFATTQNRPKVK